jgi:hypothetical protein
MLFAAVTHITDIKGGKVSNFLSVYMENNSIPNRTAADFVLENVNKN